MTFLGLSVHNVSSGGDEDEEKTEHDVTYIRIDMVEIRQFSQWMRTKEVKVAEVLIASIVHNLISSTLL